MKRFTGVTPLSDNPFLNLYDIDALDNRQKPFHYYFTSRNRKEQLKLFTHRNIPEGVTVFALTREEAPRMVLIKEYRYPLDDYIYDLPAGLIDEGEKAAEAAARELKEETGLDYTLAAGSGMLSANPSFLAPGISDESNVTTFGYAQGEVSEAFCESTEDICVVLAGKEEVKRLLKKEKVSTRAAYLMLLFLSMEDAEPFSFLKGMSDFEA